MVVAEAFDGVDAFRCEVCGFHFREREDAARCESYCNEHGGCSTALAAKALETRDQ